MTALLVSVRSVEEAQAALAGGAALIDIKEPERGALGAADAGRTWDIVAAVAKRAPVSAALGELAELTGPRLANAGGIVANPDLRLAKIGLAGMAADARWRLRWRMLVETFPPTARPVAVAYADAAQAIAPTFDDILPLARELNCAALLIDTYDKANGTLFDHVADRQLAQWIEATHDAGLLSVLGGSLSSDLIRRAAALAPSYIAVRTAACEGGRSGPVDEQKVRSLVTTLEATRHAPRFHAVRRQFQIR